MTDLISIVLFTYLAIGCLTAAYALIVNLNIRRTLPVTNREIWLDCIYCVFAWPHLLYNWIKQP